MSQNNLKSPRIDWRGWVLPIAFIALWFIATQQHWVNTRLIVPPLVHILPVLAPVAAVGLALTMVGAIVTHGRRKEYPNVAINVVLLGLALFVAWGRFGAYAF